MPSSTTSKMFLLSDIRDNIPRVFTTSIRTAFRFVLVHFSNHCSCSLATGSGNTASGYTVLKLIIVRVNCFQKIQTCLGIQWLVIGCTTKFSHSCSIQFTYQPEPWFSNWCCSEIDLTRVESCTERQHVKATSPHLILAYTTRFQNQTQLLVPLFYSPLKLFASSQDTLLPRSLDPIG
jgi:hypothetical protein